ncbi:hypothetical protein LJC71_03320 [Desulfosarcina sp. OttesenSCG-928-A07]|nr:hypothetical protein [Desulfosarcina sp. OttesenSCG-928-A07]
MTTPISMIPYINMAPYRQQGPPPGCHFVPLTPRESIAALINGDVAAAAVPVGGLSQLSGRVEFIGKFGIGARKTVMSVLMRSRVPFEAMKAPKTLHVTSHTASSVRLLYLLMGKTFGFDVLPGDAHGDEAADGELVIGDKALIYYQKPDLSTFPYLTDLAEKWFELTGLSFVFARWVVRCDAPNTLKTALNDWLERFREKEPELTEAAIPDAARRIGVGHGVIREYFKVIRRSLDDQDLEGQARFSALLAEHNALPAFQELDRLR